MNKDVSVQRLFEFMDQEPRSLSDRFIRDSITEWLEGSPLFPFTRADVKKERRNQLLRLAATHLEGNPWSKASELFDLSRKFELRKWPAWNRLQEAPSHASEIEALLFQCFRLDERMPSTPQTFYNILQD